MDLHLVGGFLGSGKTTGIIAASKLLFSRGLRVGVITNDQGKYLVDTAFMQLSGVPAVEVTGGCFCCNYDDLDKHLDQLVSEIHPDVIFAESVGSCADIVATVVKPLLDLRPSGEKPASFSVYVDARLLLLHLQNEPLPFSDSVVYIYDKQIEEAELLVMNKADLLESQEKEELYRLATKAYPEKKILFQDSLDPESVQVWVNLIQSKGLPLPSKSLSIDYDRYARGEAELAWLNEDFELNLRPEDSHAAVLRLLSRLVEKLNQDRVPIGHLKFLIQPEGSPEIKLSFTTLAIPGDWTSQVPDFSSSKVRFLVNARLQMGAERLHELIARILAEVLPSNSYLALEERAEYFHPNYPRPVHRVE